MAEPEKINRIERRRLEFRDKITRAAIKLFEKKGVADTSVASIITEADIAHKTFFNHFPTKDHLLQHIVNTFSTGAYDAFREDFKKQTDPARRLEYCFISIAKTLEAVSPHYKELLNLYLISGARSSHLQSQQKQEFTAIIAQIIEDAKSQGLLVDGVSAETYTEIAVGICVATLLNWSLEDDFLIIPKMEKVIVFLNKSIFKY